MVDSKGLLADLAHDPEDSNTGHFNAHARLVVGAEYGFANLEYVDAPMIEIKGASCRTKSSIPISLPNEWWAETLFLWESLARSGPCFLESRSARFAASCLHVDAVAGGASCRPSITCSWCA